MEIKQCDVEVIEHSEAGQIFRFDCPECGDIVTVGGWRDGPCVGAA